MSSPYGQVLLAYSPLAIDIVELAITGSEGDAVLIGYNRIVGEVESLLQWDAHRAIAVEDTQLSIGFGKDDKVLPP